MKKKELKAKGEQIAARYLDRRGYDILERNWECFAGEADIIARDGAALVFVEVKTRSDIEEGLPDSRVGGKKRSKHEKIAACYLQAFPEVDIPGRFDIISILIMAESRALIRHHINALGEDRIPKEE